MVHDHVIWYLNGLKEIVQDVVVIVNGLLSCEGRKKLENIGVSILIRENKGLDFSAWKAALDDRGWANIVRYDELILCNCSCYGPVYPFSEMFSVMEKRSCDFWGINRQPNAHDHMIGPSDDRFPMTEHIQSYFYVFRSCVLQSPSFRQWWDELEICSTYWEEVRLHEMSFSPWLESHGFIGDTFMNFQKYSRLAPQGDANFICPDTQLVEDRNPLVKRKLIFGSSVSCRRTLEALQRTKDFPFSVIVQDMARNMDISLWSRAKTRLLALLPGKSGLRYSITLWKMNLIVQKDSEGEA